jgi:hypothetical protein
VLTSHCGCGRDWKQLSLSLLLSVRIYFEENMAEFKRLPCKSIDSVLSITPPVRFGTGPHSIACAQPVKRRSASVQKLVSLPKSSGRALLWSREWNALPAKTKQRALQAAEDFIADGQVKNMRYHMAASVVVASPSRFFCSMLLYFSFLFFFFSFHSFSVSRSTDAATGWI